MSAATAATKPLLQRMKTTINGRHNVWVMLSDPEPADGNQKLLLTTHPTEAAAFLYQAVSTDATIDGKDPGADGITPQYILATDGDDPLPIRPRYTPDLFCQLGTVSATSPPTPLTWLRTAVEEPDVDTTEWTPRYYISLATKPNLRVSSSHTVGLLPKKDPYLLLTDVDDAPSPALIFDTETLCTDCGFCWTTHRTNVCQFCRAQAEQTAYVAKHGVPPESPCDCCGEPTPYGGYCSQACRWDMEGVPRLGER